MAIGGEEVEVVEQLQLGELAAELLAEAARLLRPVYTSPFISDSTQSSWARTGVEPGGTGGGIGSVVVVVVVGIVVGGSVTGGGAVVVVGVSRSAHPAASSIGTTGAIPRIRARPFT